MYSTLRIGDNVIVSKEKSRLKPQERYLTNTGRILDLKWNMAKIHFKNGSMQWIELIRVHHDRPVTSENI